MTIYKHKNVKQKKSSQSGNPNEDDKEKISFYLKLGKSKKLKFM